MGGELGKQVYRVFRIAYCVYSACGDGWMGTDGMKGGVVEVK